ncbi:DNA starvation/stationary phase protection protein Dps [Bosea eneae]|uniref:DNA starvation/stationary phase protection protein Dps n=1 Tax=Bosea eneae TaxID=151454 RepID=A0ABW0IYT8_9HYPH
MRATRNTLHEDIRGKSVMLLGTGLVHALDLERQAKQAHWNVRGPDFIALHELFDDLAEAAEDWGDLLAERAVALGGVADGRVAIIANRTTLPEYPIGAALGPDHLRALSIALSTWGELARDAIDQATAFGDADTADVFTEVSRGIDQKLWMIEAHLPEAEA